jgi:hypothetical protein
MKNKQEHDGRRAPGGKLAGFLPLVLLVIVLGLAACSAGDEPADASEFATPLSNQVALHEDDHSEADHTHLDADEITTQLNVVMVPSEIVVGPNRFAVGLFDAQGQLIHDAQVHFHYYDLRDPDTATLDQEADAQRVQDPEGFTTIFTHDRDFEEPGLWGVEVEVRLPDGNAARQRLGFEIQEDTATLGPGEKVPLLNTLVLDDVDQNPARLTSALEPLLELHRMSLAQALSNNKPTLLLLATPAYCQTRICGPSYEMVSQLYPRYADRLNFVYSEVFNTLPDPAVDGWRPSPVMTAFGLESEPWVIFIDADGTIVYRLEGMFTAEEIERQLQERFGF